MSGVVAEPSEPSSPASARFGPGGVGGDRERAELLHEAEHVELAPLLSDPPVGEAMHVHAGDRHLLVSRLDTAQLAAMGATRGVPRGHAVPFGHNIIDGVA